MLGNEPSLVWGVKQMSGFEWFLLVVVVILVPLIVAVMITLWTLEQARKRNRKNREPLDPASGPVKRKATREVPPAGVIETPAVEQTLDGMMTQVAMDDSAIAAPLTADETTSFVNEQSTSLAVGEDTMDSSLTDDLSTREAAVTPEEVASSEAGDAAGGQDVDTAESDKGTNR